MQQQQVLQGQQQQQQQQQRGPQQQQQQLDPVSSHGSSAGQAQSWAPPPSLQPPRNSAAALPWQQEQPGESAARYRKSIASLELPRGADALRPAPTAEADRVERPPSPSADDEAWRAHARRPMSSERVCEA